MSGPLTFVLLLVTVVMGSVAFMTYIKEKSRKGNDTELNKTLEKMDQLEDRIRVLERIITENKFDLKHEIDSL